MFDEFLLKMTVEGAVSFVVELVKRGFEGKHLAKENQVLVREARTLWFRKTRLEGALRAYHTLERIAWIPAIAAFQTKPLTEETFRRRMRKVFGLTGSFKTGEPTSEIAESVIKRHETGILSSEIRNKALGEIIALLRTHTTELAASIQRWDRLEDAYCAHLAAKQTDKAVTALAMKRRLRKAARGVTVGLLDQQLMTGKQALRLVQLPSRTID
jgi:hypothetical protein